MSHIETHPPTTARQRLGFGEDFRRFFTRGLAALLPTLITIFLLSWFWNQIYDKVGRHIISGLRWLSLSSSERAAPQVNRYIHTVWDTLPGWLVEIIGVTLGVILVYIVGLVIGNLLGRTVYRLGEVLVMKIPLVRAIYPAVKQVTDFLLAERQEQFLSSKVVAVEPHAKGIWSIGLVTGAGLKPISDSTGEELLTVFVPSSPTAFSGYVLVVPRKTVVELPMTVEEAMRLLVSGGVIAPPELMQKSPV